MKKLLTIAATALSLGISGYAIAQNTSHTNHAQTAQKDNSASTQEYMAANDKMHKDMNIEFSGNSDVDFFKGMIPHHQGAIDMAKVVLKHGKDPETKKMAQDIIAAQEKEIAYMKAWLAKKAVK